eukprot:4906932-Prymnesium_polylepis.1
MAGDLNLGGDVQAVSLVAEGHHRRTMLRLFSLPRLVAARAVPHRPGDEASGHQDGRGREAPSASIGEADLEYALEHSVKVFVVVAILK